METVGLRRLALGVGIVALAGALPATLANRLLASVILCETTGASVKWMPRRWKPA
jgi:hypothetical protein